MESIEALKRERVRAAAELDAAILALGAAYRAYAQVTTALDETASVNVALGASLDGAINLHLGRAGLRPFLAVKRQETAAPLVELVESQHAHLIP